MSTRATSRENLPASMPKRHVKIDNAFSPSSQDQGSLFTLIAGVVLVALVAGALVLVRAVGGL